MAKNWIGREDNTFDGMVGSYGTFPSVEGAVQQLTGVTLPFVDLSRGSGSLLGNAAVAAEGLLKRMPQSQFPEAEPVLQSPQSQSAERIRQLLDYSNAKKRLSAGQGKSFYPSQE